MCYKTLIICSFLILKLGGVYSQIKPAVWLKAEDINQGSSYWEDASGNNYKITTSSNLEFGELINYNPSVSFKNINDSILINYNISDIDHITAFVVFKNDTIKGEKSIWGSTSKTDRKLLISNLNIYDEFNQFEYSFGTMPQPIIAALSKYWDKGEASQKNQLFLGGLITAFDNRFKGNISEFIVFDNPLTELEYAGVQTYLSLKYGVGILQTDYITPKGEVIWSKEENKDYSTGIFGLARDESYNLYQKQAKDNYGLLSICVNDFFETNQNNTGELMRDSYIIASNNGNNPNYDISVSDDQFGSKLLNKCKWKINTSGTTLNQSDIILKINRYQLFKDSLSDIYLLIDKSANNDYSTFTKQLPSNIDQEGNLYFKDIPWGSSNLNSANFTFALDSKLNVELTYKTPNCSKEPAHITGNIIGNGSPYQLTVFNEEDNIIQEKTITEQTFDLEINNLGNYLLEIVDSKNNRVRYQSEDKLQNYSTPKLLETDYWIYSQPIEITIPSSNDLEIVSYNWYYNENWLTNEKQIVANKEGNYTLVYNTSSGCQLEESFYVFDKRASNNEDNVTTSIENYTSTQENISVYPNPMRDNNYKIAINIESPSDIDIELYKMDGAIVYKDRLSKADKIIYTGQIKSTGVFLLIIKVEGKLYYQTKLIRL